MKFRGSISLLHCVNGYLSHDWQNSRLLIGQLAYDMKLY